MNEDVEGGYLANLEKIAAEAEYLPIVRLTATELIANPYNTVGGWLQSLANSDLADLLDIVERQHEAYELDQDAMIEDYDNIVLLTLILAQSEGVDLEDFEELHDNVNIFAVLLTTEGLARKGFVTFNYDKVSFGTEFRDVVVAQRTKLFDDYMEGDEE
jgi:hypothetical protein